MSHYFAPFLPIDTVIQDIHIQHIPPSYSTVNTHSSLLTRNANLANDELPDLVEVDTDSEDEGGEVAAMCDTE
jgi:hypothetical protein